MTSRVRWLLGSLMLVALVACGQSSSTDDTGDGGGTGGSGGGALCLSDADCADYAKCWHDGTCVSDRYCDVDADCRDGYKRCLVNRCQPCLEDADCPSETPVCAAGFEEGTACVACRVGDSSLCPDGTWCAAIGYSFEGGACFPPNCAEHPIAGPCIACVNENASLCLGDGGECSAELASLEGCYVAEVPGWMQGDCPTGVVPATRGCTPMACFDEAQAFDTCLTSCSVLSSICGTA